MHAESGILSGLSTSFEILNMRYWIVQDNSNYIRVNNSPNIIKKIGTCEMYSENADNSDSVNLLSIMHDANLDILYLVNQLELENNFQLLN